MDQTEFKESYLSCVMAFREYVSSANRTAAMLANCTLEPLSLGYRLKLLIQENSEHQLHTIYLDKIRVLNQVARQGYRDL